jgi:hypothetical protein
MERALDLTIAYVKERKAFGQRLIDFQNTQFKLAECKTEATVAPIFFIDRLIGLHLESKLDAATASMAKYWVSDLENKIVDTCLQLFGGYGYMSEYPIARMFRDSRAQRIYGGANEIMKALIARTFRGPPRRAKTGERGGRRTSLLTNKGRTAEYNLWATSRCAVEPQRRGDPVREPAKNLGRTGRQGRPACGRLAGARSRQRRPRRGPESKPGSLPRILSRRRLGGRGHRAAQHPLERNGGLSD